MEVWEYGGMGVCRWEDLSLRDETVKSRLWRDKLGIGETGKSGMEVCG